MHGSENGKTRIIYNRMHGSEKWKKYTCGMLTFPRECWCSQHIAGISKKLADGECNFPCEGNSSLACGGSLKLSVYKMSSAGVVATPVLVVVFISAMAAFISL